jgi:hypothetical protein
MHDLFEMTGNSIRMRFRPEEITILPDGQAITAPPQPVMPAPLRGDVRIIAALVNPVGRDAGHEAVTLLNTRPDAVDLGGWALADRLNRRLPLSGGLGAGAARQLVTGGRIQLSNEGGTITLFNAAGEQVEQVSYTKKHATRAGWTLVF